jgi:L-asparaginase / beta-aspartyl-peptidase
MAMAPPRAPSTSSRVPALIIHGGAGADPGEGRAELRAGMRAAAGAGWRVLVEGGTSLDAVEAAVRSLEDHPRFNAGHGSVLTADGTVEMDASIMEGDRLGCGAVACVSRVANAVTLARRVLDEGRHVLFVADGAHAFAREHGVPECDPAALVTERQRERLARRRASAAGVPTAASTSSAAGTFGAAAIDRQGTVAAATSTGGMIGKRPGRVGDSALIGCGTYADSTLGGVSCTGDGEAIIRVVLARRALEFLKEAGDPEYAANVSVNLLVDEGRGEGGLILVDWRGRLGYAHSTPLMPVACMSPALAEPHLPF